MNPLDPGIHYQHIYVLRDGQPAPRITICYIRSKTNCAVGVAICSFNDNPCRKTGRKIALDRAEAALHGKTVKTVSRWEAQEVIYAAKADLFPHGKGLDILGKSFVADTPFYNAMYSL